jgi:hypothetical protein
MKLGIFVSTLTFLLIFTQPAAAAGYSNLSRHAMDDWTVGTIRSLSRNSVEIMDENLNKARRFVYFGSLAGFKVGERVRIIFDPTSDVVRIIKKFTPLEYRTDGQNLGYVHHP